MLHLQHLLLCEHTACLLLCCDLLVRLLRLVRVLLQSQELLPNILHLHHLLRLRALCEHTPFLLSCCGLLLPVLLLLLLHPFLLPIRMPPFGKLKCG